MSIDHERLDRLESWVGVLGLDEENWTCKSELNALREFDGGRELARKRRVQHLEWHVAQGDTECDCYNTATYPQVL